jgi:hypothetical protein
MQKVKKVSGFRVQHPTSNIQQATGTPQSNSRKKAQEAQKEQG